ncbi:hypothetical protein CRENBAI_012260 [Crenichthys baileyi]|uniref:Uncharacterized protein n=1 Tax=Crenichthys baileyi TaxID=28760 RepID=A0AAV9RYB7_9TELE
MVYPIKNVLLSTVKPIADSQFRCRSAKKCSMKSTKASLSSLPAPEVLSHSFQHSRSLSPTCLSVGAPPGAEHLWLLKNLHHLQPGGQENEKWAEQESSVKAGNAVLCF